MCTSVLFMQSGQLREFNLLNFFVHQNRYETGSTVLVSFVTTTFHDFYIVICCKAEWAGYACRCDLPLATLQQPLHPSVTTITHSITAGFRQMTTNFHVFLWADPGGEQHEPVSAAAAGSSGGPEHESHMPGREPSDGQRRPAGQQTIADILWVVPRTTGSCIYTVSSAQDNRILHIYCE